MNVNKSDIKSYKTPSRLKQVNLQELIEEVYNGQISDDSKEDLDITK